MTYIIGEIGQNHNGSVDVAKLIIDYAARDIIDDQFNQKLHRMDAVKLTKRDLTQELSKSAMSNVYNSPHAFGRTYGEHREFLELNDDEHFELYKYAKSKGLDFVETLCAINCLSMLKYFIPDFLKVASRDLTNLPLLNALAETKIPLIISTGMAGENEINKAIEVITKYHSNLTILHCLSQYPSEYKNINLRTIDWLKENYPKYKIGYSDHSIGVSIPVAAVAMGAEVIEKHITLDRNMKGTDQAGSLGIDGMFRLVRDIRNLDQAMGEKKIFLDDSVLSAKLKLERSIATKISLKSGDILSEDMIHLLSPGDGFRWEEKDVIIGSILLNDIEADEIIYPNMIKSK
jgi:sialic acid synthase SpsE